MVKYILSHRGRLMYSPLAGLAGSVATFLLLLGLSNVCLAGQDTCSRPIQLPFASLGYSVITTGDTITGIYPDIIRSVSSKETCQFVFSVVPRLRLEVMFENGQADVLLPAIKTAKRDENGIFIPLIYTRATLVSFTSSRPAIKNMQELLEQRHLRVALVRGYDYGPAYLSMMEELGKQNRLIMEADALSVARMLKAGAADIGIMAPYIFFGTVQNDARVDDMLNKIRYEAIPELSWGESGMYLSKKTLNANDRAALQHLLDKVVRSGAVWKGFQHYYKEEVLREGNRPRELPH